MKRDMDLVREILFKLEEDMVMGQMIFQLKDSIKKS